MATKKEERLLRQGDLLISIIMASVLAVATILLFINLKLSPWLAVVVAALVWIGITYLNYNFIHPRR